MVRKRLIRGKKSQINEKKKKKKYGISKDTNDKIIKEAGKRHVLLNLIKNGNRNTKRWMKLKQ